MNEPLPDILQAVKDMGSRVITVLENNPLIIAAVPVLAQVKTELVSFMSEIDTQSEDREKFKTDGSDELVAEKKVIAQEMFVIARLMRGYGQRNKVHEIINMCSFSQSDIIQTRMGAVITKAKLILALAKKYLPQLSEYSFTQEDISAFEGVIDKYSEIYKITGSEHVQGVSLTGALEESFNKFKNDIYSLDDIVDGLQVKYHNFHSLYWEARKIYHFGIRHQESPEETVDIPALTETNNKVAAEKAAAPGKELPEVIEQ